MFLKKLTVVWNVSAKIHNIPLDTVTETSEHLQHTQPERFNLIVFHIQ